MYIILILFFTSLAGIIIMIGRRVIMTSDGQVMEKEYTHPLVPDLQNIKHLTLQSIRKFGHLSVVAVLRIYFKLSNILKNKYTEIKSEIKDLGRKNIENGSPSAEASPSKFLKMISDYKGKIREIKHKIKEEENNS